MSLVAEYPNCAHRALLLLDQPRFTPKQDPTGNHLIRLQDIPLPQRLAAVRRIIATDPTADNAELLVLALHPQDASGRVHLEHA